MAFGQIRDGLENTLLLIEAPDGSGVEWMSPNDADWSTLAGMADKTPLAHSDVFQTTFADGSVHAISAKSAVETRRALVTIAAGDAVGPADDW